MALISLLSHTSSSFSRLLLRHLGRGEQHFSLLYREWVREGTFRGEHAAFDNAGRLLGEVRERVSLDLPRLVTMREEGDTLKLLLGTDDGMEFESVVLPMPAGMTLCISSQVGCRLGCVFCETGRMGLLRHLRTEEIVSQVFIARTVLGIPIRNIVFMGMGEPLDNYDGVTQAIRVLKDPLGFGFGKRQITLSTSGCVEPLRRFLKEEDLQVNLAMSLNAPTDELRNRLMPINRKHNLAELRGVIEEYGHSTGESVLVAYVLMRGVNDSLDHADQLAELLKGLNVKINLIPYNPQTRDRFQRPDELTIRQFKERLVQKNHQALLRLTRGTSIMAACGQLGNVKLRRKLMSERAL